MKWVHAIVCGFVISLSSDIGVASSIKIVGVAADNTPQAIIGTACTGAFQIVSEGTYTHSVSGIENNGAKSFTIDGLNEFGFFGLSVGGTTTVNRIDKFALRPFTAMSSSSTVTSSGTSAIRIAANIRSNLLASTWLGSGGVLGLGTYDYTPTRINTITGYGQPVSYTTIAGTTSTNNYGAFQILISGGTYAFRIIKFPTSVSTVTGTNTGSTASPAILGIDENESLLYAGHCTGAGGTCNGIVDVFSIPSLSFLTSFGTITSAGVVGIALDKAVGVWYGDEAYADKSLRQYWLGSNSPIGIITNASAIGKGKDAIAIDYRNNKIYYAWVSSGGLVIQRIGRYAFTVEQTVTIAGETIGDMHGSLQLDPYHQRLYIAYNSGTTPKVVRVSLCSNV